MSAEGPVFPVAFDELAWLKTSRGWARAVWKRSRRWGASSIGWAAYLVSG